MKNIQIPDLDGQELECIYIPFPVKLVYVLRLFFSQMMMDGIYASTEDAERGKDYFSEIEAAMLNCANTTQITDNQDKNFCALLAALIPLLTEGAIPPQVAMTLCSVLRLGLSEGDGSPEWSLALAQLDDLIEAGIGKNTNQLESYQKKIAELIGGVGVVGDVD